MAVVPVGAKTSRKNPIRALLGERLVVMKTKLFSLVMLSLFFLALLSFAPTALAQAGAVKVGDTAKVPYEMGVFEMYVTMVNPHPLTATHGAFEGKLTFRQSDTCRLEYGGTITAIALDGEDVLARYTAVGEDPLSSHCPAGNDEKGTLFFISKKRFSGLTLAYNAMEAEKEKERTRVAKLLARAAKLLAGPQDKALKPTP